METLVIFRYIYRTRLTTLNEKRSGHRSVIKDGLTVVLKVGI